MVQRSGRKQIKRKSGQAQNRHLRRRFAMARVRPRLEVLEDRTLLSVITWTNPSGGDWDTPGNWDLNRKPAASDDVVINTVGITVTHNSNVDDMARSLISQAAISLSAGSLAFTANSQINDVFTVGAGGTLSLTGLTLN